MCGSRRKVDYIRSYRKIDYSIRPAKNIERKMLGEALFRLSHFEPLENYRYIGFGSIYFSDFSLFHRSLGIKDMISIERDERWKERFEFNRPFDCIEIKFGESSTVLPSLQWDVKTILWLDYDGKLNEAALADVSCFCANAQPGSMMVVTVNAQPAKGGTKKRYKELIDRVGKRKAPPNVEPRHLLEEWGEAEVYYRIIANQIAQVLTDRNGGLEDENKIQYMQLFNFHYQNGARMLTVGGLLYARHQLHAVEKCGFRQLPFVRSSKDPYKIEVPKLTYREIRHLDRYLPAEDHPDICIPVIPDEDVRKYAKIYRYFPIFAETEM